MAADHGRLEPASLRGDLLRVARQGLGRSNDRVPFPPAPKLMRLHLRQSKMMMGRMTAPAARMMSIYTGRSSEMDDFR